MGEPVVTIKLTKSEVILLNEIVGHHIADWQEKEKVPPAKYTLQQDLLKIEEWIDERVQEEVNDKKEEPNPKKEYIDKITGQEGTEEQASMEASKRSCVLCDD